MNGFWILLLILLFFLMSELLRKKAVNQFLRAVHEAIRNKDEESFSLYLSTPQAKMLMSKNARLLIRCRGWVVLDRLDAIRKLVEETDPERFSRKEKRAYYQILFGYLVEKKEECKAKQMLKAIQRDLGKSKDPADLLFAFDCELAYDVYLNPRASRKKDLEALIETAPEAQLRAVYQYRLALVLHREGKQEESRALLKEARENSASKIEREKIDQILNGAWEW